MNKVLFVTHVNKDPSSGVWKKVLAQRDAFKQLGFSVDLVYENHNSLIIDSESGKAAYPLRHRYFIFYTLSKLITVSYDFIYIRKPHGGLYPLFFSMVISKVKKTNPLSNIVMEIPTYPYNKEHTGWKGYLSNLLYKLSLLFYRKHIEEILYIGEGPDKIYNIKARKISNGVNLERVKCIMAEKKKSEPFIFAGIANLMFWHGYDRLINSISNYKGQHAIKCYIVGDSEPELTRLKALVQELNVSDRVIFTGRLIEQQIQELLKSVNVCVDALGRHRSGNNFNSSIKSKEYTAMGMPFIKSHIDDSFLDDDFFVFQVDANENEIPIDEIIEWYKSLPDDFPLRARLAAEERFSWEEILRPIFPYVRDQK
ncbi:glycosyltransferase [Buttiauxella noackiae]|uniref:glycosyltransferase n=1 Tax=Buttiauxella noackiae TaxID=82992 RepID=UPI000551B8C8|nr:glycosyltransferase [Buttiauxella noackiae]